MITKKTTTLLILFIVSIIRPISADQAGRVSDDFTGPPQGFIGTALVEIRQIKELSDGRVMVGGAFSRLNYQNVAPLAILHKGGLVDESFQADLGYLNSVRAFHRDEDGHVLVGGSSSHSATLGLVRLNPDGSRDSGFPSLTGNGQVNAILPQPNGKFIIAGTFSSYNGETVPGIIRIHSDGSRDLGFDVGIGPQNGQILTLASRTDGRILAGGHFTFFSGKQAGRLAQLHPDGSFDESFQPGEGFDGGVSGIHPQGSKVVIAGYFNRFRGTNVSKVVRLDMDGNLDTEFGDSGLEISAINQLAFDDVEGLILAGSFRVQQDSGELFNGIVRVSKNGIRDHSFEPIKASGSITGIHRTEEGRMYLTGAMGTILGSYRERLAMISANGELSDFFHQHGIDGGVGAIHSTPDGRIIIGGYFDRVHGHASKGLAVLERDGSVDTTFTAVNDRPVDALGVRSDGKIVAGGFWMLSRFNLDGSVDEDFVTESRLQQERYEAIAIQSDDRIVAGGRRASSSLSPLRGGIVRLEPDGGLDPSWDISIGDSSSATVSAIVVHPDGRILFGGSFTEVNELPRTFIAAAKADGSLDESFDVLLDGAVRAIAIQPDGKIVIGGSFLHVNGVSRRHLARLDANGSLDPDFDPGFGLGYFSQFLTSSVSALALDPQGRIIAGGEFHWVNRISTSPLVRFLPDGTHDLSFAPGWPRQLAGSAKAGIGALLAEEDGRVLVGGSFSTFGDDARLNLVRLEAEGEYPGPNLRHTSPRIQIELDEDSPPGTIDAILEATSPIGSSLRWEVSAGPDNGSVQLHQAEGEGVVSVDYIPKSRFFGSDQFLLHVRDEEGLRTSVTVRVTVNRIYRHPVPTSAPAMAGTGYTGSVLSGDAGSWQSRMEASILITYQWQIAEDVQGAGLRDIPDATHIDYEVSESDFAHFVRLAVFAINDVPEAETEAVEPAAAYSNWMFVRREGPGRLDPSFALSPGMESLAGIPLEAIPMPDGRILLIGDVRPMHGFPFSGAFAVDTNGATDFGFDAGLDGGVTAAWIYEDGRVLLGGDFRQAGGAPSNGLVRLHADGTLDDSFLETDGEWVKIEALAVQEDGSILVGGAYRPDPESPMEGIVRLLSDGSADSSFHANHHISDPDDGVLAIVIQPDGLILAGGRFQEFAGQSQRGLVRLQPNGDRDGNFHISSGFNGFVKCLLLLPDGHIFAGGQFSSYRGSWGQSLVLLEPNGFHAGPYFSTSSGSTVHSLIAHPDGGVIAGGDQVAGGNAFGVLHFRNDGTRVSEFQNAFDEETQVRSLHLREGKLLVGGSLLVDGSERPGFSLLDLEDQSLDLANIVSGVNGPVRALATHALGHVLIGGDFTLVDYQARIAMARLDSHGVLDTSFDPGLEQGAEIEQIITLDNNQILIGGKFRIDGESGATHLARLHPEGAHDETFVTNIPDLDRVTVLHQQENGRLLVAGERVSQITGNLEPLLVRLLPDGQPDEDFSPVTALNGTISVVDTQSDGRILVGGEFTRLGISPINHLIRLRDDGQRDPTFASPSLAGPVRSLVVLENDSLAVGSATWGSPLQWLQPDGGVDETVIPFPVAGGAVTALSRDKSGKLVVAHQTGTPPIGRVYRLHPNGLLDGSLALQAAMTGTVRALLTEDTTILAGGEFTSFDGLDRKHLVRLSTTPLADDPSFVTEPGAILRVPETNWSDTSILRLDVNPSTHTVHWSVIAPPRNGVAAVSGVGEEKEITYRATPGEWSGDRFFVQVSNGLGGVAVYEVQVIFETDYESWARLQFGEHFDDQSIAGLDADPFGRGISNFASYAFGRDPLRDYGVARVRAETAEIEGDGDGETKRYLIIKFRRPYRATDVQYVVEASRNLLDWDETDAASGEPVAVELNSQFHGDGTETVSFRAREPIGVDDTIFLRVRAVNPDHN